MCISMLFHPLAGHTMAATVCMVCVTCLNCTGYGIRCVRQHGRYINILTCRLIGCMFDDMRRSGQIVQVLLHAWQSSISENHIGSLFTTVVRSHLLRRIPNMQCNEIIWHRIDSHMSQEPGRARCWKAVWLWWWWLRLPCVPSVWILLRLKSSTKCVAKICWGKIMFQW